ncbi:CTP synthase [bacterium]|jgi:CTP synthase|nr:CTP synthase [bacterium]MBT4121392.1 CTP synthase [bacterium]MBT4495907.1 CTP synthase [bacterium]MBT4764075.1 CTP synthase [bacterium]MBT5401447.1 CTP synthase [bacterium]
MGDKKTKYIFVSGGVLSGLGKGVVAASLGTLLQNRGYKIGVIKCENYINIDSGTINPIEHGDPFLCEDGLEADMDLGTYERFLNQEMGQRNFTTMGQIYKTVIDRERSFGYKGEDVEAIPHVSDEIITRIKNAGEGKDIIIIELGGTAGEYQNMLYYEACRIMKAKMPGRVLNIHVSYVPIPNHIGEPKTMPTQLSIRTVMSMGILPEFLVLRSEALIDKRRKYLLGLKTSVEGDNVIMAQDLGTIYELPVVFAKQEFDRKVLKYFNLPLRTPKLGEWNKMVKKIKSEKKRKINIVIAGKYISTGDYELLDSYASLIEAIQHACWHLNTELNLRFVNTEDIEKEGVKLIKKPDGIIVPIGWGNRGAEGKISAIKYAREKKIPYLGLCYGMQLACVEFARNVVGLKDANSVEMNPDTPDPIIHDIPMNSKYQVIKGKGTSMRLGSFDCYLKNNTLASSVYLKHNQAEELSDNQKAKEKVTAAGNIKISERHRHRFEFNNEYREKLEEKGLIISGTSPDNFFVEVIELPKSMHPFFIATQGHPEYKSSPLKPHPIFVEFLRAGLK